MDSNDNAKETMKNEIVSVLCEAGYNNSARYVKKYGFDNLNPSFTKLASKQADDFYRICLEKNCQWNELIEYPKNAIF